MKHSDHLPALKHSFCSMQRFSSLILVICLFLTPGIISHAHSAVYSISGGDALLSDSANSGEDTQATAYSVSDGNALSVMETVNSIADINVSQEAIDYCTANGLALNGTNITGVSNPALIPEILHIPEGITRMYGCYFGNTSLKEVYFPSTLQYLNSNTFLNTSTLTTADFSSCLELPKIDSQTFTNCALLQSVTLPEGIISIGENAFGSCASLSQINFPAALTSIGTSAFERCASLLSVDLSACSNLTELSPRTFADCLSLETVSLPPALTAIGYSCFANCSSLSSIGFPPTLTSLGIGCLGNTALTSVHLPASVRTLDSGCFASSANITSIDISDVTQLLTPVKDGALCLVSDYADPNAFPLVSLIVSEEALAYNNMNPWLFDALKWYPPAYIPPTTQASYLSPLWLDSFVLTDANTASLHSSWTYMDGLSQTYQDTTGKQAPSALYVLADGNRIDVSPAIKNEAIADSYLADWQTKTPDEIWIMYDALFADVTAKAASLYGITAPDAPNSLSYESFMDYYLSLHTDDITVAITSAKYGSLSYIFEAVAGRLTQMAASLPVSGDVALVSASPGQISEAAATLPQSAADISVLLLPASDRIY